MYEITDVVHAEAVVIAQLGGFVNQVKLEQVVGGFYTDTMLMSRRGENSTVTHCGTAMKLKGKPESGVVLAVGSGVRLSPKERDRVGRQGGCLVKPAVTFIGCACGREVNLSPISKTYAG